MPRPTTRRFLMAALLAVLAASPSLAQTPPAPLQVAVIDAAGHSVTLSLADLRALPSVSATLAGERGTIWTVTGPTLWSVLDRAGAIDKPFGKRVRQTITATGNDGYTSVLAMGEIDPEFENKQVQLAIDMDRHMLRVAIPGDKRLGRDVREVVSLAVR